MKYLKFFWYDFFLTIIVLVILTMLTTNTWTMIYQNIIHYKKNNQTYQQYEYETRISHLRDQVDRMFSQNILEKKKIHDFLILQEKISKQENRIKNIFFSLKKGNPLLEDSSYFLPTIKKINHTMEYSFDTIDTIIKNLELAQIDTIETITNDLSKNSDNIQFVFEKILPQQPINIWPNQRTTQTTISSEKSWSKRLKNLDIYIEILENFQKNIFHIPVFYPIKHERISSLFGFRLDPFLKTPKMHLGIDIPAPIGTPIKATAEGIVTKSGFFSGYGQIIEIQHKNGFSTRFGHLKKINVHKGFKISIGDIIGETGNSGHSTGPHLHYELLKNGKQVDPIPFFHVGNKINEILKNFSLINKKHYGEYPEA